MHSVRIAEEPLQAYNLTVADYHTYFIKGEKGSSGVWVHNDCLNELPINAIQTDKAGKYVSIDKNGFTRTFVEKKVGNVTKYVEVKTTLPVDELVTLENGLKYKSHTKHTHGQPGNNLNAGIEPMNSLSLLRDSRVIDRQRFAFDKNGEIHRFMGDPNINVWHWAGSTADKKNPLQLTEKQRAKLQKEFPEQKDNKLLKKNKRK